MERELGVDVDADVNCTDPQIKSETYSNVNADIAQEMEWVIIDEEIGVSIEVCSKRALERNQITFIQMENGTVTYSREYGLQ